MKRVVSALEMRELDARAIETCAVPGRVLMEVAGRAVAERCTRWLEGKRARIVVVCGVGNNGGDGFVAAKALAAKRHEVAVFVVGDRTRLKTDAAAALAALVVADPVTLVDVRDEEGMRELGRALAQADAAVDALLGTGVSATVTGWVAEAIDALNAARCPIIAVDIPSGVSADTGAVLGRAVRASVTVTFAYAKRGHYLHPGAAMRGELEVVDIGIPDRLAAALPVLGSVVSQEDLPTFIVQRSPHSHKGDFGHVVVLAGSPETPGAALLTLRGAMRSGAGLVSWGADEATVRAAPSRPAEVMLRERHGESPDAWAARLCVEATALVVGPGLSRRPSCRDDLRALLACATVPICLDADGLNLMAEDPSLWQGVKAPLVVTPHPKEMARLTGRTVDEIQGDRVTAALQLANERGMVVVLKGAGTVVAEPAGRATLIAAGNAGLATGGTGDVLAGVIGSLLAQRLEPGRAAVAGALLHACAGDDAAVRCGETSMVASDVVDSLGTVLARWWR